MNVSNGTPDMNTNENNGFNTQPNQGIQRPQQSMNNTQQPNLSKPNNQMGYQQTGMGNMQQNQQMGYQQNQQMNYGQQGYQQNQQMGYQQPMGQMNYQQQMGYQQPIYPVMPAKSTLGLVGLILSILSLICCGPILAIPGFICSIIALLRNKHEKRALVGTIIAVISIILWIILWITGIVSVNSLKVTGLDGVEHDILNEIEDTETDLDDDIDIAPSDSEAGDSLDSVDDSEEAVENDIIAENNVGNTGTDIAGEFHPSRAVYNGITLEMGAATATELEGILGYEFDDADMDYVVNPGYYTYTTYWVERDPYDRIIYFYFYNDTDNAIPMSECKLFRLNFYSSDYFSDDTLSAWADLDLGSGLNSSSTIDDVLSVLGEPDYTYEDDSYQLKTLEYYKIYDYEYKAEFEFKDGKLYEVTVGIY